MIDNTYVRIDMDAILNNIRSVKSKAKTSVMAIIKADAYGHGAVQLARLLAQECSFFGVSSILEARELRCAGIQTPILILGQTPVSAFPIAIQLDIRPTIFRYEDAVAFSEEAVRQGVLAPFHIAVDTGMSRIGFQVTAEDADCCQKICNLPGILAEGIFSHFASADSADLSKAHQQQLLFDTFITYLKDRGIQIPIRHLNNSAGIMNFSSHYEMVRSGIVTYGLYPSDEVDPKLLNLQPAMELHSRITHLKILEPGRDISYGGTYTTEKETTVATIPTGYADGYRRSLSGKFHVLIRGKKAPILGRICMDQMMVDVSDITGVQVGDDVVLIGKSGDLSISVEEIAKISETINYEIVCGISRRVPRIYTRDGEIVHTVHYLLDSTSGGVHES